MVKKFILAGAGVFLLTSLTIFYFYSNLFSKRQIEIRKLLVDTSEEKQSQQITIDTHRLKVPEPGESPSENDIAVPKAAQEVANGSKSKIRSFDITAEKDSFSAKKIIVYEGDIVRIYFTPKDKLYDFLVPDFGIKQEAGKGQTKLVEFQARPSGSFIFSCNLCGEKSKSRFESEYVQGALLIVPAT